MPLVPWRWPSITSRFLLNWNPYPLPSTISTIGDETYKVFLLDAESGDYYLIFNNWNNGLQLPEYAITADRDYYFRVTSTTVTEVTPTAIHSITQQDEVSSPFVYDLQGRKVGTTNTSLPKGIYIKNGKKYLVR